MMVYGDLSLPVANPALMRHQELNVRINEAIEAGINLRIANERRRKLQPNKTKRNTQI